MIKKIKFLNINKTSEKVIDILEQTEKEVWVYYKKGQDIDSLEKAILNEVSSRYFEYGRIKFIKI